ncbi:MAG TPA: hypothetical protein PLL10_09955, partial [Elusimicrobiales bacterium]|nr:hypothetical protein [Elusimicrobiales bacterium]
MKNILSGLLAVVCVGVSCSSTAFSFPIFGEDDRVPMTMVEDEKVIAMADATVAFFKTDIVSPSGFV